MEFRNATDRSMNCHRQFAFAHTFVSLCRCYRWNGTRNRKLAQVKRYYLFFLSHKSINLIEFAVRTSRQLEWNRMPWVSTVDTLTKQKCGFSRMYFCWNKMPVFRCCHQNNKRNYVRQWCKCKLRGKLKMKHGKWYLKHTFRTTHSGKNENACDIFICAVKRGNLQFVANCIGCAAHSVNIECSERFCFGRFDWITHKAFMLNLLRETSPKANAERVAKQAFYFRKKWK